MSLIVEVQTKPGGLQIVKLTGRLDTDTSVDCEKRLSPLVQAETKVLMLDLRNLKYISSRGLALMLKLRKGMDLHGGSLIMTELQPQIAKVFEIANALPNMQIFASVEEADHYLDAMQQKELDRRSEPPL